MSRATVRAAIADFFAPPAVPGLNTIFRAPPKRVDGTAFRAGQPAGTISGAVGVVDILSDTEERIALGGEHSGKKWVHYIAEIQIYQHSVHKHAEDAMADFDAVIDAIKEQLRSDRRLGNDGVIFESGERMLEGIYGEPVVLEQGATEIWGALRFEVSEVITS